MAQPTRCDRPCDQPPHHPNECIRGSPQLLRNIPAEEWVTEVAKAYPDDDEIKGMMGQVGKLMRMISYYEAKKPKK